MSEQTCTIDWEQLAREVGSLSEGSEIGGLEYARAAVTAVLGDAEIMGAVHTFLDLGPGSELARNVLAMLRPSSALQECYRLFRESSDLEDRRLAVALISHIADIAVLDWIDNFLDDPDAEIQSWGARALLELVYDFDLEELDARRLIAKARNHENQKVRETASIIQREFDLSFD